MKKLLTLTLAFIFSLGSLAQNLTDFVASTYNGQVIVSVETEEGTDKTEPINAVVEITKKEDNKIDFTLKNFVLTGEDGDQYVGNVHLVDITLDQVGVAGSMVHMKTLQNTEIAEGDIADVYFWLGPMLGTLAIDLEGKAAGDFIDIDIDIDAQETLGQIIHVDFFAGEEPVITVNPFQVANGGFDNAWEDCFPWEAGKYVETARGTEPEGWNIANVNGMAGMGTTIVGTSGDDSNGNAKSSSVVLTNTPNPYRDSQIVPGYLTLGTPWATAKATLTSISGADGGVFGGVEFDKQPDALKFCYKRAYNVKDAKNYTNKEERASVIAYTWKGHWTQKNVPTNTTLIINPSTVTMTDRSNNILGKECLTGGTITKSDDAELISSIEYYIEGDAAEWTEAVIPFKYAETSAKPEMLNIIFSANDLFGDRKYMGSGNQLTVDNVELVYFSELQEAIFNGKAISFTDGKAEVGGEYKEELLTLKSNGRAATTETSYDEEENTLTITVKGQDYENNESNKHFYTVCFTGKTEILKGDADNDGSVTIADANVLVNIYLGNLENNYDMEVIDMDNDGSITLSDANAIVNIFLGVK